MKLERKVNMGGFQSMGFQSTEHPDLKACARDLVAQMQPMATIYPTIGVAMKEIQTAYQV